MAIKFLNTVQVDTDVLYVDAANNRVGIGTDNPSQKLEVSTSNYNVSKFVGNTDDGTGYVGAVVEIESNNDSRGRGVYLTHRLSTDTTDSEWYAGVPYTGDGYSIGNAAYGTSINSATGPAHKDQSKLFIAEGGNVGIGTTSPGAKLEVSNGSSGFAGSYNGRTAAVFEGSNSAGTTISIMSPDTGYSGIFFGNNTLETYGQLAFEHASNSFKFINGGGTERMRITSAGGISFGSTGTAYGTAGQVLTSAGNASPTWTTPTTGTVTGAGAATQVAFWDGTSSLSGNSDLWWDNTNGHLGIGDTTPKMG